MDEQAFDRWFRKFNSWGFSIDEFLGLSFKIGCLERDPDRGRFEPNDKGDVVYISSEGSAMTRFMAEHWWEKGGNYKTGWEAALKHHSASPEQT
jgi:hypothetical protein